MTTAYTTQTAPVAQPASTSDEGQNRPTSKEQNNLMIPQDPRPGSRREHILRKMTPPTADGTGDRIALDGGHADIDPVDGGVEVTITIGGRITTGIALATAEARKIAGSLLDQLDLEEVAR